MKLSNLILIGMPGCGKSSVGVLLAKYLGYGFIDTDILIQQIHRKSLQDIVDQQGYLALRQLEQEVLLSLAPVQTVIATGGSAVYSAEGIKHLKQLGLLIYLQLDLSTLLDRVGDYSARGIASDKSESFNDIYRERCPLYEKSADMIIHCDNLSADSVVAKIVKQLQG